MPWMPSKRFGQAQRMMKFMKLFIQDRGTDQITIGSRVVATMDGQVIQRPVGSLNIWAIGQGFEGSASDWTEYVVWLVGFFALIWFIWQRNVMALPDSDFPEDGEAETKPQPNDSKESKEKGSTKNKR
ncbi:unnamed protein product [Cladocopium goreaui]|uniref:EH domain-containing protein n=2 Tax=Cladocopium goreaui TaxID=2562237 RepID=A0A9P1BV97_9DINO|nr:unnamed protein product [Cladocopium goreaui]